MYSFGYILWTLPATASALLCGVYSFSTQIVWESLTVSSFSTKLGLRLGFLLVCVRPLPRCCRGIPLCWTIPQCMISSPLDSCVYLMLTITSWQIEWRAAALHKHETEVSRFPSVARDRPRWWFPAPPPRPKPASLGDAKEDDDDDDVGGEPFFPGRFHIRPYESCEG